MRIHLKAKAVVRSLAYRLLRLDNRSVLDGRHGLHDVLEIFGEFMMPP
jgi:hypothetical protein